MFDGNIEEGEDLQGCLSILGIINYISGNNEDHTI